MSPRRPDPCTQALGQLASAISSTEFYVKRAKAALQKMQKEQQKMRKSLDQQAKVGDNGGGLKAGAHGRANDHAPLTSSPTVEACVAFPDRTTDPSVEATT